MGVTCRPLAVIHTQNRASLPDVRLRIFYSKSGYRAVLCVLKADKPLLLRLELQSRMDALAWVIINCAHAQGFGSRFGLTSAKSEM